MVTHEFDERVDITVAIKGARIFSNKEESRARWILRECLLSIFELNLMTVEYTGVIKESDSLLWEKFRTVYFWENEILITRNYILGKYNWQVSWNYLA